MRVFTGKLTSPLSRLFFSKPLPPFSFVLPRSLYIQSEATPNEHALKFLPGIPVMTNGSIKEFTQKDRQKALKQSPLAKSLFAIEGVESFLFGPDFISINKKPSIEWKHVKPSIYATLMDFFSSGQTLLVEDKEEKEADQNMNLSDADSNEIVEMIKELLDTRIRPAIQSDGGDVEFRGFREGIVHLKLIGSCRSCSSSAVTLRLGIENMMKHYIPEVVGIEQVTDEADRVNEEAFNKVMQRNQEKK